MLVYGLAMVGMGVQAYFFPLEGSKASIVSLIAAGGMGGVVLAMLGLTYKLKVPRVPYIVTLLIAVLAIGRFAGKVATQVYPALVTVVLSAVVVAVLLGGHMAAMRQKRSEAASG